MNGAPDQAGNWRVAQLPQWNEGDETSAEDGGSALAVVGQSKQQAAAYKFVEYLTHGKGAQTMADTGTFPSLKSILTSKSFTDPNSEANKKVNDYFGGQNVNRDSVRSRPAQGLRLRLPAVQPVRAVQLRRPDLQGLQQEHHPQGSLRQLYQGARRPRHPAGLHRHQQELIGGIAS